MTDEKDRELITKRVLPFPRERVFGAFVDPARLQQWWGPRGFTNRFEVCEPKAGGEWRFVMCGPDGQEFKNESRFEEFSPERIVIRHHSGPKYQMTITLDAQGGQTAITWRMVFDHIETYRAAQKYAVEGNEQNLDRLTALLSR
jgi:uncharacterized protein YndB with AHSA1/START domain